MGTVDSCCCCSLAQGTVGAGVYTVIRAGQAVVCIMPKRKTTKIQNTKYSNDMIRNTNDMIRNTNDMIRNTNDMIRNTNDMIRNTNDMIRNTNDMIRNTNIESVVTLIRGGALLRKLKELQDENTVLGYIRGVEAYDKNQLKTVYRAYGWGYVIIGAIYLLLAVMIFVAVSTRRRNYLLPWLGCTAISFMLVIIGLFFSLSSGIIDLVAFARGIIELAIMAYLYIVVYSYYNSLQPQSPVPTIASRNLQTPITPPGYVIQPPEPTSANFKSDLPSYPEAISNADYTQTNVMDPYAEGYSHFPPPPSYSEAVKIENK
uniref:Uncharacterized protein n=1 Tax=Strigamia maritima TaxID=126957 RepID=T1ILG6_STRMM